MKFFDKGVKMKIFYRIIKWLTIACWALIVFSLLIDDEVIAINHESIDSWLIWLKSPTVTLNGFEVPVIIWIICSLAFVSLILIGCSIVYHIKHIDDVDDEEDASENIIDGEEKYKLHLGRVKSKVITVQPVVKKAVVQIQSKKTERKKHMNIFTKLKEKFAKKASKETKEEVVKAADAVKTSVDNVSTSIVKDATTSAKEEFLKSLKTHSK
jgi:hypothetical protein